MTSLRHAFGFLTIFPVGPLKTPPTASSTTYFPLVGLALGGILAGLDLAARQVLPMPVVGALLLVALLITTRAIHIEGFLDSCDGLLGGSNRTQRLRILRDSRVGAFAVVGGVGLLLLKWTLLVNAPIEVRTEMLVLFPCLSRFGMLSTMVAFSYVREQGLGTSFRIGRNWRQLALGFIIAAAAAGVLMGAAGLILHDCLPRRLAGLGLVGLKTHRRNDWGYLRRSQRGCGGLRAAPGNRTLSRHDQPLQVTPVVADTLNLPVFAAQVD